MKNIRQPPMIHHCNQTEYIQRGANLVQMAADACAAMYLPDRMKKLLTFYADCPDGFFPALKTIHDATGMNESSICKARKELVDVGFILYTPEEIRIDWQRVATMAMLPPEACFSLRRRSMPERTKVEKIKPAFWKREPMKWTTPKGLDYRPRRQQTLFLPFLRPPEDWEAAEDAQLRHSASQRMQKLNEQACLSKTSLS